MDDRMQIAAIVLASLAGRVKISDLDVKAGIAVDTYADLAIVFTDALLERLQATPKTV